MNIPHASMVFELHEVKEITAKLLNGGGRTTEVVRHADIVSFTCLKAFAYGVHQPAVGQSFECTQQRGNRVASWQPDTANWDVGPINAG